MFDEYCLAWREGLFLVRTFCPGTVTELALEGALNLKLPASICVILNDFKLRGFFDRKINIAVFVLLVLTVEFLKVSFNLWQTFLLRVTLSYSRILGGSSLRRNGHLFVDQIIH
jgi:hypothetical protein